jgi:hypothetical protein
MPSVIESPSLMTMSRFGTSGGGVLPRPGRLAACSISSQSSASVATRAPDNCWMRATPPK